MAARLGPELVNYFEAAELLSYGASSATIFERTQLRDQPPSAAAVAAGSPVKRVAVPTRNPVGAFDEPSTARYQGLADTWRESPKARVGIATDKLVHQWPMTGE